MGERAMKMELPATAVQELIKSSGSGSGSTSSTIPHRYIFHPNAPTASLPWMDTPVVDLRLLLHSSPSQQSLHELELRKLRSLLCTWGCFQLINHGVGTAEMDELRALAKQFFGLPHQEKKKYSRTADWFEGYGSDTVSEGEPFNWNDRLHLKTHPLHQRNLNLWPQNPSKFKKILDGYGVGMKKLVENVLKAIAKSLDVEEDSFWSALGEDEGIMFTRFNLYPPCSTPDRVYGLKPHSDVTMITILLQDKEVEGLQVLKDDQWFKVPILPHAFFINVGDQLEIMSNGILKSVVHKVVIDKERERMSVAVASIPTSDKEIGPVTALIDRQGAQLYKKVTNYIALFLQHIARGERAINAIKM